MDRYEGRNGGETYLRRQLLNERRHLLLQPREGLGSRVDGCFPSPLGNNAAEEDDVRRVATAPAEFGVLKDGSFSRALVRRTDEGC